MIVPIEEQAVDKILIELVQKVSALEATISGMQDCIRILQTDIGELKTLASEAKGATSAMKALWVIMGLLLGAGWSEALQAFVSAVP